MRIIGGKLRNREIKTPKGEKTRPTVAKLRRSFFDMLQDQILQTHFLDLFAGSGAMGIEALSRGAKRATFVEKDRQAFHCIKENLKMLGLEDKADVFFKEAFVAIRYLKKNHILFDLIYVDPPYHFEINALLESLPSLLSEKGILILEQRKNKKVSFTLLQEIFQKKMGDAVLYFFSHK